MDNLNLQELARQIIKDNIYLSLATCGEEPWVAPLYYCIDDDFNFYFISLPNSRHIKHIKNNPNIAFAIYDSRQKEGTGVGVQGYGKVECLKGEELEEGLKHYKTSFVKLNAELLESDQFPYRLYKITPTRFFVTDPDANLDKRVEVDL